MLDYESPQKKSPTDWSGTIMAVVLAPVFLLFVYLGKPELGFNAMIVLGVTALTAKFRWKLRKHVWFWATIVLILALHIPLLFMVHWPQTNVPTIVYSMPIGIVDFLLISGALNLAEKVFSKSTV